MKIYIHGNVLIFFARRGESGFARAEAVAPGERLNFFAGRRGNRKTVDKLIK